MIEQSIKEKILKCLKEVDLYRIIIFGSYAYGVPSEDSDIDLIIISSRDGMSKSYRDHIKNKNKISKRLLEIKKKYPIDIIVYTKDEWALLKTENFSFIKKIEDKGIDLL